MLERVTLGGAIPNNLWYDEQMKKGKNSDPFEVFQKSNMVAIVTDTFDFLQWEKAQSLAYGWSKMQVTKGSYLNQNLFFFQYLSPLIFK